MTASQPAPLPQSATQPDPLSAAKAPAPVAAGKDASSAEPQAAPKKKSSANLFLLVGLGLLLLVGGGAALSLLPKSAPVQVTKSPPVPPDPGTAPPVPQFNLQQVTAVARNGAPQAEHAELIGAAAKRLQTKLLVGAGESAAPREFIVRGGGASDAARLELPNHERWEIQFPPGLTIEAYTRQLDFFKIELGVVGGSQQVSYLSNLSNPKPQVRTAPGNTDTRLYLIWNRGPMREADEILAARAGINIEGKVLAHFCPPALEAEMLRVEAEQARTNNFTQIRRTVFGIQQVAADTFRLAVIDQKGD